MLTVVLSSAVLLLAAYFTYGRLLERLFGINPKRPTPAVELQDGRDFEPIGRGPLMSQHFSAIAAAGPIVGPILAGLTFGWLPALIWILVGSILVGGVHDYASLVASIRHKAQSVAEVVRQHMSHRSYLLFLTFIWIALVYIVVAFTDITATAFVGPAKAENGGIGGGAVASSSLMYLVLTLLMGLATRYLKLKEVTALAIFLPLVALAIVAGKWVPLDVEQLFTLSPGAARKVWDVSLLVYCLIAGVVPVWLLLQPRGQLGGYFLYAALGAGALGLVFGGAEIQYPAFRGWEVAGANGATQSLVPLLFITIACGACSGFHGLIASGTTSKQLRSEADARPIGYGTMLLEAMVAVVSLSCVMMFKPGAAELTGGPNMIYAQGIGSFAAAFGVAKSVGIAFALMAFCTFVYDTLDVCTRLGRYIFEELTGWRTTGGSIVGAGVMTGVPLFFLLRHPSDAAEPVWRTFWALFGASNQLLAALTLLGVTVWLWRTQRAAWVWLVTGVPTLFMYTMSSWALVTMTFPKFHTTAGWQAPTDAVPWLGLVLLALAALMAIEAVRAIARDIPGPPNSRALATPT